MAERLRVWLVGGHECDLDLGEGSAQELMEKIEKARQQDIAGQQLLAVVLFSTC